MDELNTEVKESEQELKVAAANEKAHIQSKLDGLKEKQARMKEQMQQKAQKKKQEWERKIQRLEKKMDQAKSNAKERLKERREKLRQDWADYNEAVDQAFI